MGSILAQTKEQNTARSSTTYVPKWHCGRARVLRVPEVLADEIMSYARDLDLTRADKVREDGANYTLGTKPINKPLYTEKPVNVASVSQRSPFRYPGGKTRLVSYCSRMATGASSKTNPVFRAFCGWRHCRSDWFHSKNSPVMRSWRKPMKESPRSGKQS